MVSEKRSPFRRFLQRLFTLPLRQTTADVVPAQQSRASVRAALPPQGGR